MECGVVWSKKCEGGGDNFFSYHSCLKKLKAGGWGGGSQKLALNTNLAKNTSESNKNI